MADKPRPPQDPLPESRSGPAAALMDDAIRRSLLLCLRGRWDAAALARARDLAHQGSFSWEIWYQAARTEALTPLLYRTLQGQEVLPGAVEEKLRIAFLRNAARNARAFRELEHVLADLGEQGIPAILLKGAALAETVYGNIAVRPMIDLDLLVARDNVPGALRALQGLGYQPMVLEAHPGAAVEYENEVALTKPGAQRHMIEIHWSLLDSPHHQQKLALAWLWDTAQPARVGRSETLVLGPEALLLHLCGHLSLHHRSKGMLWLADVAEILHVFRDRLSWELLLAKATEYDLVLPLQQVLPSVVEDWGAPAPTGVLDRLRRLEPSPEEVRVFKWLTASQRPVARRFWADLASMPSWRQRLSYGVGSLFPSPSYMRHRYRIRYRFLLPLYYPYRWLVGLHSATRLLSRRENGMT